MLNNSFGTNDVPSFRFFFNDTATTEIYTLSLHDALPISPEKIGRKWDTHVIRDVRNLERMTWVSRSEEHTSELQSRRDLVCRLLLEKKKKNNTALANYMRK